LKLNSKQKATVNLLRSLGVKKVKKPPAWSYPLAVERSYLTMLRELFSDVIDKALSRYERLERLAERYQRKFGITDGVEDDVEKFLEFIGKLLLLKKVQVSHFESSLGLVFGRLNKVSDNSFSRIKKQSLGFDFKGPLIDENRFKKRFIKEQMRLVRSKNQDIITHVQRRFASGIYGDIRHEEIRKDLKDWFNKKDYELKRIARDQVSKYNGRLAQERMASIGVNKYVWRTAKDSRVRDHHTVLEGKRFSFSKPPAEGNPGQPIQCRCYAEPVFDFVQENLGE
jgi:SPP1 gp7 family putative phage head morphogenesis protein